MRLMIDTNIFLDVLAEREPFFEDSKAVLNLCENKKVQGFPFLWDYTALSGRTAEDLFVRIFKLNC